MKSTILQYLAKQQHNFKVQSRAVFENSSPKKVHKLRINIRQIQAVLWIMNHSTPRLSFKKLTFTLRKLRNTLGIQRQLHVTLAAAKKYNLNGINLDDQIRRTEKQIHRQLKRRRRKQFSRRIEGVALEIQRLSYLNLADGISKLEEEMSFWIQKKTLVERELHPLRIASKKTRYILEAIGKPTKPLRNLQHHLGRLHDLSILSDFKVVNSEIRTETATERRLAKRLAKPALRFSLKQLKSINNNEFLRGQ